MGHKGQWSRREITTRHAEIIRGACGTMGGWVGGWVVGRGYPYKKVLIMGHIIRYSIGSSNCVSKEFKMDS